MNKLVIKQCEGNGQGECRRCTLNGRWNHTWMCFLYKIEGLEGCYCVDCVMEYKRDVLREEFMSWAKGKEDDNGQTEIH